MRVHLRPEVYALQFDGDLESLDPISGIVWEDRGGGGHDLPFVCAPYLDACPKPEEGTSAYTVKKGEWLIVTRDESEKSPYRWNLCAVLTQEEYEHYFE